MLIIGFIIAGFFIFMICMIAKSYLKDIIELENRDLQLEKRINECEKKLNHEEDINKIIKQLEDNSKQWEKYMSWMNIPDYRICNEKGLILGKDGEKEMACKGKGKGGKRK